MQAIDLQRRAAKTPIPMPRRQVGAVHADEVVEDLGRNVSSRQRCIERGRVLSRTRFENVLLYAEGDAARHRILAGEIGIRIVLPCRPAQVPIRTIEQLADGALADLVLGAVRSYSGFESQIGIGEDSVDPAGSLKRLLHHAQELLDLSRSYMRRLRQQLVEKVRIDCQPG